MPIMDSYPIGLHAKPNFFRCCSTTWNDETKEFILSRMISGPGNIKPIFVVNENESVDMYEPNSSLTKLVKTTPTGEQKIFKMQCRKRAYWMIERTKIQKTDLSPEEKEDLVNDLEQLVQTIKVTRLEKLRILFHI